MEKLIALLQTIFGIFDSFKSKTADLQTQLNAALADNAALKAQLANVPQQVIDAQKAAADATAKAADDQAQLDALHAQADAAAADVQAHIDSLNPAPPAT